MVPMLLVLLATARLLPTPTSRRSQRALRPSSRDALLQVRGGAGIFSSRRGVEENETQVDRIVRTRRGFYPQIFIELEPQASRPGRNSTFCVQQVQGTGDCLFHSIAIGMAFADNATHLDMHDKSLDERVCELRTLAVDTLERAINRTFYEEGDKTISVAGFVAEVAEQFNRTSEEYITWMRRKSVWGGGPEILALVDAMKRPIHVFQPVAVKDGKEFRLELCGAFGSPKFDRCGRRVCIVAADDRFPMCKPLEAKRHGEGGNHFLALLPTGGRELPPQ